MAGRILRGFQQAAVVFHNSLQTGEELTACGLVDPARLCHAPLGIAPEFRLDAVTALESPVLPKLPVTPWVLHVGSCIPRKRIDILLDIVSLLRIRVPGVRLVKVGGDWTAEHQAQIDKLGLRDAILHIRGLTREELAEVYRRASVVLVPSESEGFGLPVIEALACGAVVVASDIPVLREVGGEAVIYRPLGDCEGWADIVSAILFNAVTTPSRATRLEQAGKYSWREHVKIIGTRYEALLK